MKGFSFLRPCLCWGVLLCLLGPGAGHAQPAAVVPPTFVPSAALDLPALIRVVLERTASLQEDHLAVELGQADVHQSRLIDNPVIDGAVGTIPVGPSNPPDLVDPLANVPNYSVGISVHPNLARRGVRIDQSVALLQAADAKRRYAARTQALRLLRTLGDLATATLRMAADSHLLAQARNALTVARERVRTGFGPPLDGDRAEIEQLRIEQQVAADLGDILAAKAACAEILGVRCEAFEGEAAARGFLSTWLARGETLPLDVSARPDLQALAAQHAAALAETRLARRAWVPDPTVRVGYTYDRFVISGNQQHSLNVSLSVPLPLLDHGQAAEQAGQARQRRLVLQRQLTLQSAQAKVSALLQSMAIARQRLSALQQQVLPRVQAVLRNVGRAFEARAVPLTDVIQAQRSMDELLLQEATALGEVFRLTTDLIEESADHE